MNERSRGLTDSLKSLSNLSLHLDSESPLRVLGHLDWLSESPLGTMTWTFTAQKLPLLIPAG